MMILFTLSILHDYFEDGLLQGYQLVPDASTHQSMARFGLSLRTCARGITIFSHTDVAHERNIHANLNQEVVKDFRNYYNVVSDNTPLVFHLRGPATHLYTISSFPLTWSGQLLYSSSVVDRSANGLKMSTRFDALEPGSDSLAKIHVYPADLLRASTTDYFIKIAARQTVWRYYLFNRGQRVLKNVTVVSESGYEFESIGEVAIVNQGNALSFTSADKTYALEQRPSHRVRLMHTGTPKFTNSLVKTKFKPKSLGYLPAASPSNVNFAQAINDRTSFSDMYVYL